MSKKEKKHIYEIIMNTANILVLLDLLIIVIVAIINYTIKMDDEIFMSIMIICLGLFVLLEVIFIPMLFYYLEKFDSPIKNVNPYIYNTNIKDFNRFKGLIEKKLKRKKFIIGEVEIQGMLISYAINNKLFETNIFIYFHIQELEENIFSDENNLFKEVIKYLYKKKLILYRIKNCRYIICIDRENNLFNEIIKEEVIPEVKFNKLQVIISLDSMKIFINKYTSVVSRGPYNKMKKEFLDFIKCFINDN